ncbi:hypothetical protein QBC39DRAFT_269324 [Podospora conica]|nr:hypothetical protein QBC39DRAFT_269324 [Schizothecium conicum]
MSSKGKTTKLVQTKLSFGKRGGSLLGDQDRLKKERRDSEVREDVNSGKLKPESPLGEDGRGQGLGKEKEVKGSGSKEDDEVKTSRNSIPSKATGSPTSKPSTSNPPQSRLPIPKATTTTTTPSPVPTPSTAPSTTVAIPSPGRIHLVKKDGDYFSAPPNTVLIHACNCKGSWGGGIAKEFKTLYPDAYDIYRAHCQRSLPHRLVGTALLIAPRAGSRRQHYVGCLFTSKGHGRTRDPPDMILGATGPAMRDLMRQIVREGGVRTMRMCHINSGLFAVPWEGTKAAIEGLELGEGEVPGDGEVVRVGLY